VNRDTRLLPYIVAYESVMKSVALSDEAHDLALAGIMTKMEEHFGVPNLNKPSFNRDNQELIELYRKIGDARIALGDEGVFQVGCKIQVVDGQQRRTAKAYDKKDTGTSVWYLCVDEGGEWGYAFDEATIKWTDEAFIYDCQEHNTPLSEIMSNGAGHEEG
jgi:hypothetical protein